MNNLDYIKHQIRHEVKVDSEGKGFCTVLGVARLANVSDSTLGHSLKTGSLQKPSKLSKFLISQGFEGSLLVETGEKGVPDMLVGAILEYYAFEAGRYRTEQASLVYRAMARIGIRAWMRGLVGYKKPTDDDILTSKFIQLQLPSEAKKWEHRFKPEFWAALKSLYGLTKERKACGRFIAYWVYGYFPKEVKERLDEINPTNEETGFRKNCHHQHFDDILSKALDIQISLVTCNLIKAVDRKHFHDLMKSAKRYKFTIENLKALEGSV